jgi:CHAT domain-containing protein
VLIRPEGALRYLPFATLHDGTHWLVQRHTLALSAGGVPMSTTPASPARSGWALFGSSRGVPGLPPLAQVPGELAAIRMAMPPVHSATTRLDAGFTAPRLQAALAQRSVVHIASHFVLAPGDSRASWLQLGGGERVSLAALAGDAYRFDGLDLLTLSACDTAVPPGVDAQGRSLDSLAWLAHARGAKNVLASLWPVPDASTAALMGRFYQHLAAGQGKADALRSAQLALLAQPDAGGQTARGLLPVAPALPVPQNAVRHPYYWGAFVLLSNK